MIPSGGGPRRRRCRLLPLILGLCLGPGCVTLVSSSQGGELDARAVSSLQAGRTTLPELLALLGAPQEVHRHPDGLVLVYRHKARHTFRLGLRVSQALSVVDVSQVASEALQNVNLTIERIHAGEDRLVLLLDHSGRLLAAGHREGTRELPWF